MMWASTWTVRRIVTQVEAGIFCRGEPDSRELQSL